MPLLDDDIAGIRTGLSLALNGSVEDGARVFATAIAPYVSLAFVMHNDGGDLPEDLILMGHEIGTVMLEWPDAEDNALQDDFRLVLSSCFSNGAAASICIEAAGCGSGRLARDFISDVGAFLLEHDVIVNRSVAAAGRPAEQHFADDAVRGSGGLVRLLQRLNGSLSRWWKVALACTVLLALGTVYLSHHRHTPVTVSSLPPPPSENTSTLDMRIGGHGPGDSRSTLQAIGIDPGSEVSSAD